MSVAQMVGMSWIEIGIASPPSVRCFVQTAAGLGIMTSCADLSCAIDQGERVRSDVDINRAGDTAVKVMQVRTAASSVVTFSADLYLVITNPLMPAVYSEDWTELKVRYADGMGKATVVGKVAAIPFLLSALVYALTMCPTDYVEVRGEKIGAVSLLGTPHPTGYPLFCLLGRLVVAVLPTGNTAFEVNIASGLTCALAVGVLAALLHRRGLSPWTAGGTALVFGFSATFWNQAVIAEVYGLSMLGSVYAGGLGVCGLGPSPLSWANPVSRPACGSSARPDRPLRTPGSVAPCRRSTYRVRDNC